MTSPGTGESWNFTEFRNARLYFVTKMQVICPLFLFLLYDVFLMYFLYCLYCFLLLLSLLYFVFVLYEYIVLPLDFTYPSCFSLRVHQPNHPTVSHALFRAI